MVYNRFIDSLKLEGSKEKTIKYITDSEIRLELIKFYCLFYSFKLIKFFYDVNKL